MTSLDTVPADWPGWQFCAPLPGPGWTTVAGRPGELWEIVQPLDVTTTGRRHHAKVEYLLGTEYGVPKAWRHMFRTHGELDQGEWRAVLARQMFGRQPGYVARIGLDDLNSDVW